MSHEEFWADTKSLRKRYNRLWLQEHTVRTFRVNADGLARKRLAVHEELAEFAIRRGGQRQKIDRVTDLDPATFKAKYYDPQLPVVFAGVGKPWRAFDWTPQMLGERYAESKVRLLRIAPNEGKGRPGEGRDASYKEIVESMDEGGDLYARFSGLLHQHPELVDDLDLDWFREMRQDHKTFENWGFFMGGTSTATALHSSIAPNLFYQISGEKRWYIYQAKAAPFFAPAVKCSPYFYSFVDVDDAERFPVAEATPGWIADLEPGDVLWVPAFAWHQVHNFSPTVAVGYRWMNIGRGFRASWVQTVLAATCTNPPPWQTYDHTDLPTLLDAVDY